MRCIVVWVGCAACAHAAQVVKRAQGGPTADQGHGAAGTLWPRLCLLCLTARTICMCVRQMAQRLNKPETNASHKARRPSASADVKGEVNGRRSRLPSFDFPDDHHHQSQRHAFMPPPNQFPRHFSPERMRTPQLRHHSSQPHLLPGSRHGTGKRTRPSTAHVKLETSSWFHDMETRAFAILAKKPASPPQAQPRVV